MPVSSSSTNRTPSGGPFTRSRTSRATLANVRGGKFSELPTPPAPPADPERDRAEDDRRDGLADDPPPMRRPGSDPEREGVPTTAALALVDRRRDPLPPGVVEVRDLATLPVVPAAVADVDVEDDD